MASTKIKQTYEDSPFKELIFQEVDRPDFLSFLELRIKESSEWKMSHGVTDYFNNFNKYPAKLKNVLVVNNHKDIENLKGNKFFADANNTLVLCLNNTFSTNKSTGKNKSHFDYWRVFVSEALDYIQTKHKDLDLNYIFVGDESVYDFAELISEENHKVLLPESTSVCYKDKSFDGLELGLNLK